MDEARDALSAALQALLGVECRRSLATNSLKLVFDFRSGGRGRYYIWIDPPWRMTLTGRLVTGSYDWPRWDGVEDKEVNEPLWNAWCSLLDPLNSTVLVGAAVNTGLPDLRLDFESGHRIETFGHSGEGYWWYYRDRLTGEIFEADARGITRDSAEPIPSGQ